MEEEKLCQIIREELSPILAELSQIRLHLLAISQATGAVPWKNRYLFAPEESEWPRRVLLDYCEPNPQDI